MIDPALDPTLMARVADGDHGAFTQVMSLHEDRVFSVCLRILGDREKALDATQETFLTVFRKAGQFKGNAAPGTWIYRIAVNASYDQLRKLKRRRANPLPDSIDIEDMGAEQEIESAAMRPEIQAALAQVPRDFRAAIVLVDIEGMSLPDAAAALGSPVGTIKSRLFRGRRILAGILEPKTDVGPSKEADA